LLLVDHSCGVEPLQVATPLFFLIGQGVYNMNTLCYGYFFLCVEPPTVYCETNNAWYFQAPAWVHPF